MISNIAEVQVRSNLASSATYGAPASSSAVQPQDPTPKKQNTSKASSDLSQSVKVTLSDEALKKLGLMKDKKNTDSTKNSTDKSGFSQQELQEIEKLKARDKDVRTHELAHMMIGGTLVRKGASYQYETGPDGIRYAIGGEVSIDTSPVQGDPEATIRRMEQVKRAAEAPSDPSAQDQAVAATANQAEIDAEQQLRAQTSGTSNSKSP